MQKTFKPGQFIFEVGILVVIFTLVQYLITSGLLNQYYQINLASICINIILAVSLSLTMALPDNFFGTCWVYGVVLMPP